MADPADRLAAWAQAAIRVEDSGDASHFAPLCRIVPEIDRREREFIAKAIEGFQGCRLDVAPEVKGGRELTPSALWGPIADALHAGDVAPLVRGLRTNMDFDQGDIDALARIFWMLRLVHTKGHKRAGTIMPSPSEARLQLAAGLVKNMQAHNLSRAEAVATLAKIDSSLNSENGELGGKLTKYLDGRRGSSRRRRS
jgi:hypothetical protein